MNILEQYLGNKRKFQYQYKIQFRIDSRIDILISPLYLNYCDCNNYEENFSKFEYLQKNTIKVYF